MSQKINLKNVYQLVYASKVVEGFSEKDLIDILNTSRKNNKNRLITGALVYNKGYFLQMLEGDREAVETLFNIISDDSRHEKANCFFRAEATSRIFPDWYMGFFQHEVEGGFALSDLVNLYDSQHPASQFFVDKLLEVQATLQIDQSNADANNISELNWIIEEICSPSMRLMFDMLRDPKLAIYILRLKLGFDSLSVGVIITDLERNIAYINRSAVNILSDAENDIRTDLPDFDVDNLIGKNIDLFHKYPAHQINILDKLTNTKEYVITIGGRLLSIKTTAITDEFKQRIGFMAEIDDITVREQNKVDLEISIENNILMNNHLLYLQKLESLSRLTSGIAHDFNNLLMAIMGNNDLNKLSTQDLTDKATANIDVIQNELFDNTKQIEVACNKAKHLIDQMLSYCRRDHSDKVENPVLDVNNELHKSLEIIRRMIPNAVHFELDISDKIIPIQQLDESNFSQMIINLCTNAADAIGNTKGTITFHTGLTQLNSVCSCCQESFDGNYIEISVADNGSGIDPVVAKRIFEPFYTTKQVGDGTGLGLSVIVGMVHNADGHILLESKMGVGSTFRLLFPKG